MWGRMGWGGKVAAEPCCLVPGTALGGLEAKSGADTCCFPLCQVPAGFCGEHGVEAGVCPCKHGQAPAQHAPEPRTPACVSSTAFSHQCLTNPVSLWPWLLGCLAAWLLHVQAPLVCQFQCLSPVASSFKLFSSLLWFILILHTSFSWSLQDFVQFSPFAKSFERPWEHKYLLLLSLSYTFHVQQPGAGYSCCLLKNKLSTCRCTVTLLCRRHQWDPPKLWDHRPCPLVKIFPCFACTSGGALQHIYEHLLFRWMAVNQETEPTLGNVDNQITVQIASMPLTRISTQPKDCK